MLLRCPGAAQVRAATGGNPGAAATSEDVEAVRGTEEAARGRLMGGASGRTGRLARVQEATTALAGGEAAGAVGVAEVAGKGGG